MDDYEKENSNNNNYSSNQNKLNKGYNDSDNKNNIFRKSEINKNNSENNYDEDNYLPIEKDNIIYTDNDNSNNDINENNDDFNNDRENNYSYSNDNYNKSINTKNNDNDNDNNNNNSNKNNNIILKTLQEIIEDNSDNPRLKEIIYNNSASKIINLFRSNKKYNSNNSNPTRLRGANNIIIPNKNTLKNNNIYTYIGKNNSTNSLKEGFGIQKWKDGSKFIGYFKNDKSNDFGKFIDNENNFLSGNFIEDKLDGFGIYLYNNGTKYIGEWVNDYKMELALNIGKMDLYIKENLKKVKKMVLESIYGLMELNIMENGKIIVYLDMEYILFQMNQRYILVNGKII